MPQIRERAATADLAPRKSWKDAAGRIHGHDGYRFGDMYRSCRRKLQCWSKRGKKDDSYHFGDLFLKDMVRKSLSVSKTNKGTDSDVVFSQWFVAASQGNEGELQSLLDEGGPEANFIDVADARSWTALMIAAAAGHANCVLLLTRRGCTVDMQDARGWTAATHAAAEGNERCLRLLAEAGANLEARDFLGTTAGMRAAMGGHTGCLKIFIDHGTNLSTTDRCGMTALEHARVRGHKKCVEQLGNKQRCVG